MKEQERIDRYLVTAFSRLAPLPEPAPSTPAQWRAFRTRWLNPLRTIYDVSIGDSAEARAKEAADTIAVAIDRMDEADLTISAPASIQKVAIDIARRKAKNILNRKPVIW